MDATSSRTRTFLDMQSTSIKSPCGWRVKLFYKARTSHAEPKHYVLACNFAASVSFGGFLHLTPHSYFASGSTSLQHTLFLVVSVTRQSRGYTTRGVYATCLVGSKKPHPNFPYRPCKRLMSLLGKSYLRFSPLMETGSKFGAQCQQSLLACHSYPTLECSACTFPPRMLLD